MVVFFDIKLEENFFDCAVSLHTIYHIDKDRQEDAVRKLLKVTKPGKPIIIVYSNPNTIIPKLMSSLPFRLWLKLRHLMPEKKSISTTAPTPTAKSNTEIEPDANLYFYPHPIEWWSRFNDAAQVLVLPWRSFSADLQKELIPNNKLGGIMFNWLFRLEDLFPDFFGRRLQYPMIVLTKK
jgi:hypothetical protein